MNEIFNEISVVRIYFRYGQPAQGQTFWQRFWSNSLGRVLLKKAKEMKISQANIFMAKSGYLGGDKINFNISEIPPDKNPVCLELIDTSEKLQSYLEESKSLLENVNVILLNDRCFELVNPF